MQEVWEALPDRWHEWWWHRAGPDDFQGFNWSKWRPASHFLRRCRARKHLHLHNENVDWRLSRIIRLHHRRAVSFEIKPSAGWWVNCRRDRLNRKSRERKRQKWLGVRRSGRFRRWEDANSRRNIIIWRNSQAKTVLHQSCPWAVILGFQWSYRWARLWARIK